MKKKSLRTWIRENNREIDAIILKACPNIGDKLRSDDDRRGWVLNDEALYLWARGEGAEVD